MKTIYRTVDKILPVVLLFCISALQNLPSKMQIIILVTNGLCSYIKKHFCTQNTPTHIYSNFSRCWHYVPYNLLVWFVQLRATDFLSVFDCTLNICILILILILAYSSPMLNSGVSSIRTCPKPPTKLADRPQFIASRPISAKTEFLGGRVR